MKSIHSSQLPRSTFLPETASASLNYLRRAIHTAYLFSRDNLKDIICLGFVFGALNSAVSSRFSMGPDHSFGQILNSSPGMLLWSSSNLFIFNLHNQRHPAAVAEDLVNKPWRPLPSGRITPEQTTRIMYCMYPVILSVAFVSGGLGPCIFEAFLCLWYNEWGGASHPFLKNVLNGFGFACFLAGPLEVATKESVFSGGGKAAAWLLMLAVSITTTSHTQDFRDMEGDKATGRNTVPLVIGDMNARLSVALGVVLWNYTACWFWGGAWKAGALAWVTGLSMVGNLFWNRSREGDVFTWKLWPFWMFGLFILPALTDQVF